MEATATLTEQLSIFDTIVRTPAEIDTELADLHRALAKIEQRIEWKEESLKHAAGAKYYYRGRKHVTDMPVAEARKIVEQALAEGTTLLRGTTLQYFGKPTTIEEYDALLAEQAEAERKIIEANRSYTGWSRFFLVTSSKGHIHSHMNCSTCRPTTTFGWLPTLSGRSETEAVEECGPALCSVCFPSAPVEWTLGQLTKAQAEKKAEAAR